MEKTPQYDEGNTRDPRNPSEKDPKALKAAAKVIENDEARSKDDLPPDPRPT